MIKSFLSFLYFLVECSEQKEMEVVLTWSAEKIRQLGHIQSSYETMISKVSDFQIHIRGFDSLCLLISVFSTYISFNLEYATFYIFPISIIASTTLPFFLKTFTARFLSTPSCFTIKSMSSFTKPSSLSEISPNARKRALLNSML